MSVTVMALPLAAGERQRRVLGGRLRPGGRELDRVVHRPDGQRDGGQVAQAAGVGGAVGEAVRAEVIRVGDVVEAAAGVEVQRAVRRTAHQERLQSRRSGS